jgi:hypothetical protein
MKRLLGAIVITVFVAGQVRADDQSAKAILDKAIQALGGEQKLAKAAEAATWKAKGTVSFGDNRLEATGKSTIKGLDHWRSEWEGDFGGNRVKAVTVISGDKGWRRLGDQTMDIDADGVANEKRNLALLVIPATILPLKGKGYKVESDGEEKVADKPAVVLKITGPAGKDFKISFDKQSGLPVKVVATVVDFRGEEFTQETIISDYKDFDGIKKATKVESKRNGERFVDVEVLEFKVLDNVPADTFAEPK